MADAVGMIEVEGVAGIIVGADAAAKAASVELMGWESIGGFTPLFFRGPAGAVATALGLGADKQENKFFDNWVAGAKLNTAAARDIIWRNRGTHGAKYLADIVRDKKTPEAEKARYLRALDFIPMSKEKDDALKSILKGAL